MTEICVCLYLYAISRCTEGMMFVLAIHVLSVYIERRWLVVFDVWLFCCPWFCWAELMYICVACVNKQALAGPQLDSCVRYY